MSYFNRRRRHAVVQVLKQEEIDSARKQEPLLKADSEPMQQSANASEASSTAYQTGYATSPPLNDQIKAHRAAASAHGQAAKAHRTAGKAAMSAAPTVGAAHFQQAQQHDQSQQSHASQAQGMQDSQDCGYR